MNTDKLMELERKWRDSAAGAKRYSTTEYEDGFAAGENACADELAALRAEQAVGEEQIARDDGFVRDLRFLIAYTIPHPIREFVISRLVERGWLTDEHNKSCELTATGRALVDRALGTARQSEGVVLVPRENVLAAAALLEGTGNAVDRREAEVLRKFADAPGGEGEVGK